MTFQVQDRIFYRGNEYWLQNEPLEGYDRLPQFFPMGSDNHRGYTAVWGIVGEHLFIVSLSGCIEGSTAVGLELVFPGCQTPIRADWYSGELVMQHGRLTSHLGHGALFEYEEILSLECGRVTGVRTVKREWKQEHFIDPICFRTLDDLDEMSASTVAKLNAVNIEYLGDLIQLRVTKLLRIAGLDVDAIESIEEQLAARGLVLGTFIKGWSAARGTAPVPGRWVG